MLGGLLITVFKEDCKQVNKEVDIILGEGFRKKASLTAHGKNSSSSHTRGEGVTRECAAKDSTTKAASHFASVTLFSAVYSPILSLSLFSPSPLVCVCYAYLEE